MMAGCTAFNDEYTSRDGNLGDDTECGSDADCAADEVCSEGVCEPAEAGCQSDAECADGTFCDRGACVPWEAPECEANADCGRDRVCALGECWDRECEDEDADGFCADGGDCDDQNALVHPGAAEERDGLDNDCDGEVDEDGDACRSDADCRDGICVGGACREDEMECRSDADCRGGICLDGTCREDEIECRSDADCRNGACVNGVCRPDEPECEDADADGVCAEDGDCDDRNPGVHPGAREVRDGLDNDCDGQVDEGGALVCAVDSDCPRGLACVAGICAEPQPECRDNDGDGFCPEDGDCDDRDASIHPDAEELRDGLDNDCDGQVDEGDACASDADCGRDQACFDGVCR